MFVISVWVFSGEIKNWRKKIDVIKKSIDGFDHSSRELWDLIKEKGTLTNFRS